MLNSPCVTSGGRRVSGGGGIYPDVLFGENAATPLWLSRVGEQDLVLAWVGGYVSANAASLGSLDAFLRALAVSPRGLAEFRAFAAQQGVAIPAGAEADAVLQRVLVRAVARARWGEGGAYSAAALADPEVAAAVKSFDRAAALTATAR